MCGGPDALPSLPGWDGKRNSALYQGAKANGTTASAVFRSMALDWPVFLGTEAWTAY